MNIDPKRDYSPGLRRMRTFLCLTLDPMADHSVCIVPPSAEDMREALLAIETHHLTVGALRVLVQHPDSEEARAHAQRVLAECGQIFTPAPKAVPPPENVEDLL